MNFQDIHKKEAEIFRPFLNYLISPFAIDAVISFQMK